jgi:hypothetical protein
MVVSALQFRVAPRPIGSVNFWLLLITNNGGRVQPQEVEFDPRDARVSIKIGLWTALGPLAIISNIRLFMSTYQD